MTRLSKILEERGTTIRQLSAASGIHPRTVYRHVRGVTKPDLQQAAAYARALNVEIAELCEDAA